MAETPYMGYVQMDRAGEADIVTMQAGGSDVGFWNVVNNCVFHEQNKNYGPDWPDPNGECVRSMVDARMRINMGLRGSFLDAVWDVLNSPGVRYNQNFHLYILGYSLLFADDDEATWCNTESFVVPWRQDSRQKLTLELRKELNSLVEAVNSQLQALAEGFNDTRIGYIDISHVFDGGRFCECQHSLRDQYQGSRVFLWNAIPEGVILDNGAYTVRAPTAQEFDQWYQSGMFTYDWNEVVAPEQRVHMGPFQNGQSGLSLRPVHPKQAGHEAIAQAVTARFKKDINPGDDCCDG